MTGWDAAAAGYEAYWVPRFAPWVAAAVDTLPARDLPAGPVLVPCCGTLPELEPLIERLPGREVVGIDLSPEMVRRASARAAAMGTGRAEVGDAAALSPAWTGSCAAVVSVFGLQQLPDPAAAAVSWFDALRPGGRLTIVYWPSFTEHDGPFALMDALIHPDEEATEGDEERVAAALAAADAEVERDEPVAFRITHADAGSVFDAHTSSGSLRAWADERGPHAVAALRAEYVARAPRGEWSHTPEARLISARRPAPLPA